MNLADKLQHLEPNVCPSPWSGYEHSRGYAAMVLPFSSGHLLGLRVFPENDFAPYMSVWHCTPDGGWTIYNDGPSLETTCPRWWGQALRHADLTRIEVEWVEPNELRVQMKKPRMEWTMKMTATSLLKALNAASAVLPLWTWKPAPLLRLREWVARKFLDMGDLRFSFVTPSGQQAVIMPEQLYMIKESEAVLDGRDLGRPVWLQTNPTIGGVPLPRIGVFVIGQAYARISNPEEYRLTRERYNR